MGSQFVQENNYSEQIKHTWNAICLPGTILKREVVSFSHQMAYWSAWIVYTKCNRENGHESQDKQQMLVNECYIYISLFNKNRKF